MSDVKDGEIRRRGIVARVGLRPEFIDLAGSFEVAGDVALIVRGDVEPLALAHTFAKIIGLAGAFRGSRGLPEIAETGAHAGMSHGEVSIQTDCALEKRNRRWKVALHDLRLVAKAVGFESLKRRGGDVLRWHVVFLHRGQRFTKLFANFRCGFAERLEYLFFSGSGDLIFSEQIAGAAIYSFDSENVLASQAGY